MTFNKEKALAHQFSPDAQAMTKVYDKVGKMFISIEDLAGRLGWDEERALRASKELLDFGASRTREEFEDGS